MLLELIMIVKNSGDVLRRCLHVNKKYIDRWTILDTGSTDDTPDIIREELKDVPGQLHFSEFTNFSEARNKVFDLSTKECKYMIVLDDSYEIRKGDDLRDYLKKTKKEIINLKIGYYDKQFFSESYWSARILKTKSNLRYIYRVHECINLSKKTTTDWVDEKQFFIVDHKSSDHSTRTSKRLLNDIEMLLLDSKDDPRDPRPIYYLARTYANLNNIERNRFYLKKLLDMTTIKEFTFYAEWNLIQLDSENDGIQITTKKLLDLQKRHTNRAEPSYKLAVLLYEDSDLKKVNHIMDKLSKCTMPFLVLTLCEYDIYEYGIPYLYIEVKLKLGLIQEAVPILQNMLSKYVTDQRLLNMKYSICDNVDISRTILSDKTLVINACTNFTWNPRTHHKISGSEYMAMYMAKEFRDIGFRVFIFGNFEDKNESIDYQDTIDGIQYIDYTYYSEFCLKYIVDYLIVSRACNNLLYYHNVKNVYLWLHDVLPAGDFRFIQIHKEKFKAVICISEWQKQNVLKYTKIDKDSIYVSRNAIHPKRFLNHSVERTPLRFMFSVDASRGIDNFMEMIPWIKSKYPLSTFYIITRLEMVSETYQKIIQDSDHIFLSDRVNQKQIVIELLKTDIWLYPSCFEETYCISALEAMASGCLVATLTTGALPEIVDDRGVLANTTQELFEKLCLVLENPEEKQRIIERAYEWSIKQDFFSLALDWKKNLF